MQSTQPVDVPTPRTDACEADAGEWSCDTSVVPATFARHLERELSKADAELERTKEQLRVAREALMQAKSQFIHYATLHFMKDTPVGDAKGRQNELMADKMRDALAFTQPQSGAVDPVKGEEGETQHPFPA